ncbi:Mitochondrial inner membrane protein oxa1 [Thalictrum thalictroides]|uniref:Mitochondrial inner membrane protein oxa1 n=1 Tax=Thalictrum thalictroides TaxID=46969 RepID=A0A7J6WMB2_THATH|nr:Mitochondrial inner membrane protein oxa1 [Thalictrum thalictroides]
MAYRRTLSTRVTHLTQRFHPSFTYIFNDDDRKSQSSVADSSQCKSITSLNHGYPKYNFQKTTPRVGALFRVTGLSSFSMPMGIGSSLCCNYSTTAEDLSDKIEYTSDVAHILSDNSVELAASQASVASEVATAAADSYYPIAALQYFIDGIHSFTGLNWWASIALTTIIIRGITIPVLINQLKCTTKLTLMRPHLEKIKQEMENKANDPNAFSEGQRRMKELFNEYGVTPFAPLKGLAIQGPIFISFYLAITNLVDKVPSFKEGGTLWFTDLTTPDSLYILPVLTGLSFLITVECNVQEGLEGNPVAGTIKKFSRGLAVLTVPFTMTFPKAIFCYWVTSNLFSLAYGLVIKRPKVKQFLNIPLIPEAHTTTTQPALSTFPTVTASKPVVQEPSSPSPTDHSISSSSVINQRIRTLEKQVKGIKKKNKKV